MQRTTGEVQLERDQARFTRKAEELYDRNAERARQRTLERCRNGRIEQRALKRARNAEELVKDVEQSEPKLVHLK